MASWQDSGEWVAFPKIPKDTRVKHSINGLFLRAFGRFKDDLIIDFKQKVSPYHVTLILQSCTRDENGEKLDQAFFWDLTVGKRIECLLTIATLGPDNPSTLAFRFRCSSTACQQQMEMDIPIAEFTDLEHQTDDSYSQLIELAGENLNVRKPTARDQLEWLKYPFDDEKEAAETMVRTLIVDSKKTSSIKPLLFTDEVMERINKAMEDFDPLVNFRLQAQCPYCSDEDFYELELEKLALQKLYESRLNLLKTIHRLATQYHWSEQQILAIPPWRQSHYLTLIGKEETR